MSAGEIVAIVSGIVAIIIGIIGFFIKRLINQVDQLDCKKASKEEVNELGKKVDGLEKSVGDVKTNYLTKEDFYREQAKTDRKLDDIIKILMDIKGIKGGCSNG